MQKFMPRSFFAMNAPDPPHWTLNSWFYVFRSVWVHLVSFHCLMKLGSKRAELVRLMQKFMPQNRVRIFGNERSWFTPLDPKLMFWCVLLCLGAFGTISTPYETQFKTGRTGGINGSCHEVGSEYFAKNSLDPPHGAFET